MWHGQPLGVAHSRLGREQATLQQIGQGTASRTADRARAREVEWHLGRIRS